MKKFKIKCGCVICGNDVIGTIDAARPYSNAFCINCGALWSLVTDILEPFIFEEERGFKGWKTIKHKKASSKSGFDLAIEAMREVLAEAKKSF